MRKYYLKNVFIGCCFILVLSSAIMSASGPGGGYANGPNESNCTSCHGGTIITSGNSNLNNVRLKGNFSGNGYIPDSTYTIEITHKQVGIVKFGFEVTCLDKANNPCGTLTSTNSRTSKTTATISGQQREYIQHTSTGTASVATDSTRWTFTWKAPNANIGNVKFYVVVMSTNNNSTDDPGDAIYGKVFTISPSSLLPVAKASSNDTITCTNYNVQLNGSGTNSPTTYTWKLTGATPSSSTVQNPIVTYAAPGIKQAILTVKNAKGVSFPDTMDILVNTSPSAVIITGSNATICKGDSLQISANTGAGITYQWQPPLNKTSRQVYVKDSGSYTVKVSSTTNGCARTSAPFILNLYGKPTIAISKINTSDSFCGTYNETITASGNFIDSVVWYANGIYVATTKSLSRVFTGSNNIIVQAMGKSINNCKSLMSNSLKLIPVPKLKPSNFSTSKTTSTIDLKWNKVPGVSKYEYRVDAGSLQTVSDSTVHLSGLNPNTTYVLTIRSYQKSPCIFVDTSISIKTSACSNLTYSVNFNNRTCKGNNLTVSITKLYAAKYSISFNNQGYSLDTIYTFNPISSDSLHISIIDSLSPTCPPIVESLAYTVDTLIDKDTSSGAKSVNSCANTYQLSLPLGYSSYHFFKNNVEVSTGASNSFTFINLSNGDKLTGSGQIYACSRTYGPVSFTLNPKPVSTFSFTRSWKTYNFQADNNSNASYSWRTGSDILGNSASFSKDMSVYNNSSIDVTLMTTSSASCKDSSTQTILVPNFSSIHGLVSSSFKVYPNPFSDHITIESEFGNFKVQIFDHLGREITDISSNQNVLSISSDNWSNGVYHILITDNEGAVSSFIFVRS